jgi:hypothetical protein
MPLQMRTILHVNSNVCDFDSNANANVQDYDDEAYVGITQNCSFDFCMPVHI